MAETKLSPAGRASLICTLLALLGPLSVTVTVNVMVSPTLGAALLTVLVSARSACCGVSAALALWRDGKIKVLAVLDSKRAATMPEVPTTAEAGMPELLAVGWFAMVGPPKMPLALRDEIAKAAIEVLKMPDVQGKFRALSVEPGGNTPAETAAFIKDEARRWGAVIKQTGVVVD